MNARVVLTLLLALSPVTLLGAEPRHDRSGAPLPEGAVARFGSGRLLHGGAQYLEFSPDGKVLATSGDIGVRLWDVATGKVIPCGHLPPAGQALFHFARDGSHVVGDADGCRLLDAKTGKVRCSWGHGKRMPRIMGIADDGKIAAVAWEEGGVTVHDLTRTGPRNDWKLADDKAYELSLSGDGTRVAYAMTVKEGTAILLWDTRKGKLVRTFAPEAVREKRFYSLCLNRDGSRLAASWGERLLIWDTASGAEGKGSGASVPPAVLLRFSDDGEELVGASPQGLIWHRSLGTGKERVQSTGHERFPTWYLTLSPDGRTVATLGRGGEVVLSEADSWKDLFSVERWPEWRGVSFVGPDVVATYTEGREKEEVIAFWDVAEGKLMRKRTIAVPEDDWWRRALSPDGKLFAMTHAERGVLLFDVETGKEVRGFDVPRRSDEGAKFAFSPDGKTMALTDYPKGLRLYDVATGKGLHRLEGDGSGVMAFSPDGRMVASSFVKLLHLTEVASGKVRYRLPLPYSEEDLSGESIFERIRFARDGRSVAAFSISSIVVYSTTRGSLLLRLDLGERTNLWSETGDLSPDGRWLAHGDNMHCAVAVRDMNNPRAVSEYQTLTGHGAHVNEVVFSPDGKYLVSCGGDGTAIVWDARQFTGKPTHRKPGQPNAEVGELHPLGVATHWATMGDADAGQAAKAMTALEEVAEETVALLKDRLKPAATATSEEIERLIGELESDAYAVREKAMKELKGVAEQAEPALRKTLAGKPSAEAARQVKQLLSELEGPVTDAEQLRQLRAVEVLERIGTPAAREVVERLARGAPAARLTSEAKGALARWEGTPR